MENKTNQDHNHINFKIPISGTRINDVIFHKHGTNAIYVVVDIFITATPLRLLHFFHGLLFGAAYIIFSVIYTMAGGTNNLNKPYIYGIIDWKSKPQVAVAYAVSCVFVGVPMIWLILYGLYRLRIMIYESCSKTTDIVNGHVHAEDMMTHL